MIFLTLGKIFRCTSLSSADFCFTVQKTLRSLPNRELKLKLTASFMRFLACIAGLEI